MCQVNKYFCGRYTEFKTSIKIKIKDLNHLMWRNNDYYTDSKILALNKEVAQVCSGWNVFRMTQLLQH